MGNQREESQQWQQQRVVMQQQERRIQRRILVTALWVIMILGCEGRVHSRQQRAKVMQRLRKEQMLLPSSSSQPASEFRSAPSINSGLGRGVRKEEGGVRIKPEVTPLAKEASSSSSSSFRPPLPTPSQQSLSSSRRKKRDTLKMASLLGLASTIAAASSSNTNSAMAAALGRSRDPDSIYSKEPYYAGRKIGGGGGNSFGVGTINGGGSNSKERLREYQGEDEVPRLFPKAAAQEECLGGWKYNWRNTGEGAICVEPDGCVWRKLETSLVDRDNFEKSLSMYNRKFTSYLSRFFIHFEETRGLGYWRYKQSSLNPKLRPEEKDEYMRKALGEYALSLQYGLGSYTDPQGSTRLLQRLLTLYGGTPVARKQLLLAFSMLPGEMQPKALIKECKEQLDVEPQFQESISGGIVLREMQKSVEENLDERNLPWLLHSSTPLKLSSPNDATSSGYYIPYNQVPKSHQFLLQEPKEKAASPVSRERRLNTVIYAVFAAAGLAGCTTTHGVLVPLDVVKTRLQTNPDMYPNLIEGAARIYKEEGGGALLLGAGATVVGYSWYGLTVYPGYELLKRELVSLAGETYAETFHVPLVLMAGALATVVACIGVTPAETARIRIVAQPDYADSFVSTLKRISKEEGVASLFQGFGPLATRQVLFGMMKFFIFDSFADEIFRIFPSLTDTSSSQLFVSFLAGAVAGLAASVVSQPADTILSKMKQEGGISFVDAFRQLVKEFGLAGLYLGLPSRILWATPIIAGQFFLYDLLKNTFQVASEDLNLFFDVLSTPADFIITHY